MVEVPVRHEHIADVFRRYAHGFQVFQQKVRKGFVRGVDEHPAVIRVHGPGRYPGQPHLPYVVEGAVLRAFLAGGVVQPCVQLFGHASGGPEFLKQAAHFGGIHIRSGCGGGKRGAEGRACGTAAQRKKIATGHFHKTILVVREKDLYSYGIVCRFIKQGGVTVCHTLEERLPSDAPGEGRKKARLCRNKSGLRNISGRAYITER